MLFITKVIKAQSESVACNCVKDFEKIKTLLNSSQ